MSRSGFLSERLSFSGSYEHFVVESGKGQSSVTPCHFLRAGNPLAQGLQPGARGSRGLQLGDALGTAVAPSSPWHAASWLLASVSSSVPAKAPQTHCCCQCLPSPSFHPAGGGDGAILHRSGSPAALLGLVEQPLTSPPSGRNSQALAGRAVRGQALQ